MPGRVSLTRLSLISQGRTYLRQRRAALVRCPAYKGYPREESTGYFHRLVKKLEIQGLLQEMAINIVKRLEFMRLQITSSAPFRHFSDSGRPQLVKIQLSLPVGQASSAESVAPLTVWKRESSIGMTQFAVFRVWNHSVIPKEISKKFRIAFIVCRSSRHKLIPDHFRPAEKPRQNATSMPCIPSPLARAGHQPRVRHVWTPAGLAGSTWKLVSGYWFLSMPDRQIQTAARTRAPAPPIEKV